MRVTRISDPDAEVVENCPAASTVGVSFPSGDQLQSLFSREANGQLKPSLRDDSLVSWGNARRTLACAAVLRLIDTGAATAAATLGDSGPLTTQAVADLAVTGSKNVADFFFAARLTGEVDIAALGRNIEALVPEAASRLGATLAQAREADIALAVYHVLSRALSVLWALHGPVAHRMSARPALGWIAVSAERDAPPRPVNVPATSWPCSDLVVSVNHDGRSISTRIRYAIAGARDADDSVSVLDRLPNTEQPPLIPDDCLILVFLHGHSSRLEEAGSFYQAFLDERDYSAFARPFAVVSFDFPSNGYSESVDHDQLSSLQTTTSFVPDHPEECRFGMLEYYEKLTVAFVEELDRRVVSRGRPTILPRIAAVVGGSMGGNLGLRLSERLVTNPSWLGAVVSWSPASIYASFGRADYLTPSPGEHFDPIAKEALERPHLRCAQPEDAESRGEFIGLQMQGERLINDGTPEFEVGTRVLAFFLPALVGGLAPLVFGPTMGMIVTGNLGPVVFGSVVVEGLANVTTIKQSDEWLRPDCRGGFDSAAAALSSLMFLNEIYNGVRRRMHWRIAYEQLLFSHQDEVATSRGLPCYAASTVPTLLVAAEHDVVDAQRFNIFGSVRTVAPRMINNPGRGILVNETGHSIHAERPRWLARQILDFIHERRPLSTRNVHAVTRDHGRITHFHLDPLYKPLPYERLVAEARGGGRPYFAIDSRGNRAPIVLRRFLTTVADDIEDNNLRALPSTTQSEPLYPTGIQLGFEVTHIRVQRTTTAEGRPHSWVSHLCNDSQARQVSVSDAERAVQAGVATYFIVHDGRPLNLVLREFLSTAPDSSAENNLSNLPDADV